MHQREAQREAFTNGIEDAATVAPAERKSFAEAFGAVMNGGRGATDRERASWLCGQLWHCTGTLPGDYCDDLDIPSGNTYARAARVLKRLI